MTERANIGDEEYVVNLIGTASNTAKYTSEEYACENSGAEVQSGMDRCTPSPRPLVRKRNVRPAPEGPESQLMELLSFQIMQDNARRGQEYEPRQKNRVEDSLRWEGEREESKTNRNDERALREIETAPHNKMKEMFMMAMLGEIS